MDLRDSRIAVITPVGVLPSHDSIFFDTSWGRFLDAVAGECRWLYTCGRSRDTTSDRVFTYALGSKNVSVELLPPARSSLHSLPQLGRLAVRFLTLARRADVVFIRGIFPGWLIVVLDCLLRGVPISLQLPGDPLRLLLTHKRFAWWRQAGSVAYMLGAYLLLNLVRQTPRFHLICNGRELAQRFPGPRTHIVVSASLRPDELFPRSDTCNKPRLDFLFVGLVRPEKGLTYLLRAVAGLQTDRPWTLHIVGRYDDYPSETARLNALAKELRVDTCIKWHGHVPFGESLFEIFKACDVFLLPSLSEGTPRVLVEAGAFGLPVVATRVGGIPTSITDGVDGLLVPSHSPEALQGALQRLLRDPSLRRRLISNGYARARDHTVDDFARRVLVVMKHQLGTNPRKSPGRNGVPSSRPRVLVVAANFKPLSEGVAEYAHQMAHALRAHGAETLVLSPQFQGAAEFDSQSELSIQRTRPRLPHGRISVTPQRAVKVTALATLWLSMWQACRAFSPDIVYLPSMFPFGALALPGKPRLVTTFHGGELFLHCQATRLARLNRWLLRRTCQRSALVLANSRYTAQKLVDLGVEHDKILVTGCGADWGRFRNARPTEQAKSALGLDGRKVLLTVGRLDERKGFDSVIKCIPDLKRKFPDILYVAVGAGPMAESLKTLAQELDVSTHVRMTGRVPDEEVVTYMAACDVFIMPNRQIRDGSVEGFGIVFLEANACGKPVIAGRSGGAIDAVEHNVTGLLVDPYSLQEIGSAIERLLRDPRLAAEMGRRGRERVAQSYSWEVVAGRAAERMIKLLDDGVG